MECSRPPPADVLALTGPPESWGLESALTRGALFAAAAGTVFEPRVDAHTGALVGFEARRLDPTGHVGAAAGAQALALLEEACGQAVRWAGEGLAPLGVAVDLSACAVNEHGLERMVTDVLVRSRLSPVLLELELSEAVFAAAAGAGAVRGLRGLGIRVAITDFAAGPSLEYLAHHPVDAIRLGRPLVSRVTDEGVAERLARLVSTARCLGLHVVAAGVASPEALACLRELGCDRIQGPMVSHPLVADDFARWAREHPRVALEVPAPPSSPGPPGPPETPGGDRPRLRRLRLPRLRGPRRRGAALRLPWLRGPRGRGAALRLAQSAIAAGGLALGAVVALPVRMPAPHQCPPQGEGLLMCQLQKGWLPSLSVGLLVAAVVLAVALTAPDVPGRVREWRRLRRLEREGPRSADPLLRAASWNAVPAPRRGRRR